MAGIRRRAPSTGIEAIRLADHDSAAPLARGAGAPGQAPRTGNSEVAAAIVTEVRARRDGLAADERRARTSPRSRQILTQRQRQNEASFISGLLLALTHAAGQPYDIAAAEQLIGKGAEQ